MRFLRSCSGFTTGLHPGVSGQSPDVSEAKPVPGRSDRGVNVIQLGEGRHRIALRPHVKQGIWLLMHKALL